MEQLQSHVWLTASSYIITASSYIRKPFLIYDLAIDPLWISFYMRKIWFSYLSVYSYVFPVPLSQMHICMIYAGGLSLGATMNVFAKKHWQKFCMVPQMHRKKHERAGVAYSVRSSIDTCTVKPIFTFKCQIHGLVNYIDTKAKCRHLKRLTCKGIMRQMFIRVSHVDIFDPALWTVTPLPFSLVQLFPFPPSLCE